MRRASHLRSEVVKTERPASSVAPEVLPEDTAPEPTRTWRSASCPWHSPLEICQRHAGGEETMGTEQAVAQHYTHGSLERAILDGLRAAGKDLDRLEPHDLAPVDEFHIGGRQATIDFAGELAVTRGMHLLDIGSGLGGASRHFAHALGCRV